MVRQAHHERLNSTVLRVEVYARAVDGLLALEPDWNKQRKYFDFIDAYAELSEDEVARYSTEYIDTTGGNTMGGLVTLIEEKRQESWQNGRQEGRQEGEASLLLRLMELRFGSVDATIRHRLQAADAETLLRWGERLLNATSAEEVLHLKT